MKNTISREIHIYGQLTTHNITHDVVHTRSSASKNIPTTYEERTTRKIHWYKARRRIAVPK